jgi:hypothetical protein
VDNRWHRILELLEVPTIENLQVQNNLLTNLNYRWLYPYPLMRAPGKMNLNGMRNAENLFALLDDPNWFWLPPPRPFVGPPMSPYPYQIDGSYQDRWEAGVRNWWQQLLQARDGIDYQVSTAVATALGAPPGTISASVAGSPAARPFRSFSFAERTPELYLENPPGTSVGPGMVLPNSGDDTLLRTLPLDAVTNVTTSTILDQRRLFEARTNADRTSSGAGGPEEIDYYARQRLLSKIAGNTTNRSNVFIVWITIGFFDGLQDPANPGVTQIGSEISTPATRRRGFFIVDRSLLEDAWNSTTGTYDFRKFVQYRKILQ